ncbi:OadG family protein [Haloferula sp.]|uniref:OadG family protein n=1 Tax=Haloferula sp. TaxID=2497595 RepID=UPI003C7067E5
MITEGFELMLVGMSVVFAFLILLVGFMHLSGRFFARFSKLFPDPEPSKPGLGVKPVHSSEKQAVALAAAYRARRGS